MRIVDLTKFSKKRDIEDLTNISLNDSIIEETGKNKKNNQKLKMLIEEAKKRSLTLNVPLSIYLKFGKHLEKCKINVIIK